MVLLYFALFMHRYSMMIPDFEKRGRRNLLKQLKKKNKAEVLK